MLRHAVRRILLVLAFIALAPAGGAGQEGADVLVGLRERVAGGEKGDPDIHASTEILWVMKHGRLYDPGGLLDGLLGAPSAESQHVSQGAPDE
jgi:hypothetical protein